MKQPVNRQGITKVFLSSTFRDLEEIRKCLLDKLIQSLDAAAMENFVSTGEKSQITALKELRDSSIAIFLISSYYGSDIKHCECMEPCKADCGMKDGTDKICYTWCEYRVARSEHKLLMPYLIDEGWDFISQDGAPKVWNLKREVEQDLCPRIKKNEEGVEKVLTDLFTNVVTWYSTGTIDFTNFCGRRDLLKELVTKMKKSVNVHGVGGIGKTTICEVALLLYRLLGRMVCYIGSEEAYASGTGYKGGEERLSPKRVRDLTLDDITDALRLGKLMELDNETKIDMILHILDEKGIILFIDDFKGDEGIRELIHKGNGLHNGCILVSSKQEMDAASFRIPVENIEEAERERLIEIMALPLGKTIAKEDAEKIKEIAEGHPIATYVLISNVGRVPVRQLMGFKEGLDFSRDDDVKEYMQRVIERGISPETFELLKDISVIEEDPEIDVIYGASHPIPHTRFGELVDASILERIGNRYVWKYNQIKEAVFDDAPERHQLARKYYDKKVDRYGKIEDRIEMLYHATKVKYKREISQLFIEIANSMKKEDPAMRLLPKLGEEIVKHVEKEEKGAVWGTLGTIYWSISNFRDRSQNCKKAIAAYEEALRVRTFEEFPIQYAMTQNNLGTAYRTLGEVEDKSQNCKKAIAALKEALRVRTFEEFPMDYATTQNNLGNAYRTLGEVEEKSQNCKKAIAAYEEALRVYTFKEFPMDYAMTQNNLGVAYKTLGEVEDKSQNCKKAIAAYKEALRVFTEKEYPEPYHVVENNLRNLLEACENSIEKK